MNKTKGYLIANFATVPSLCRRRYAGFFNGRSPAVAGHVRFPPAGAGGGNLPLYPRIRSFSQSCGPYRGKQRQRRIQDAASDRPELEQFLPHDNHSPQEVAHVLIQAGLQPVWKDWEPYLGRTAVAAGGV